MKQKHRLTALLTSLCLLLSMLPISSLPVLAANGTLEGDGTEESPYQIADGDDLKAFRDLVNGGGNDAWAVLTADIVLNEGFDQDKFAVDVDGNLTYDGSAVIPGFEQWTPIGKYNTVIDYLAYTGTFDGQGHTISGLYINTDEDDVSSNQNFGLFSYLGSGGVIQNLELVNSLVRTDERNVSVAGVVAYLDGAVQNCYNAGTVSGLTAVGGVVGSNNSGTIENCYNTGTVSSVYGNAGGVVSDNSSGTIENCYNTGTVSSVNGNAGGVVGFNNSGTIKNCYNTGTVSSVSSAAGGVVGFNNEFMVTIIENCYYLQGSASAGIGSGPGSAVSKAEIAMKLSDFLTALNAGQDPAPWQADHAHLNGGYPILAWQNPFAGGSGVEGDPFLIAAKEQLEAFRDLVNGGDNDAWGKLTADIDLNPGYTFNTDGTYTGGTAPEQWTPIGDKRYRYTGTFDGNGHTVSGLYINNSSEYQGLFGHLDEGGTIQNLGVINSYIRADSDTGSIVGYVCGSSENRAKITGCFSAATVITTGSSSYAGGIAGDARYTNIENCYNTGSVHGNGTYSSTGGVAGEAYSASITNCYNTGSVNGGEEARVGGVAGYASNSIVTNCYNTGTVSGGEHSATGGEKVDAGGVVGQVYSSSVTNCYSTGAVSGGENADVGGVAGYVYTPGTVTNCYYLNTSASAGTDNGRGEATAMTQAEMQSADFVTTLNGGQAPAPFRSDFNTLGSYLNDGYPILSWQNPFAGGSGVEGDPFLIATKEQLEAFRDLVNGGANDAWAVLTADIVLNEDLDQDKFAVDVDDNLTYDGSAVIPAFEQWTPIGSYNTVIEYLAYTGTFDGQGHTISGLYINTDEDDVSSNQSFGLFSYLGSGGVIQNLGLVNSLVRTDERNVSVAGVVARLDGAVQNCYNAGTVSGVTAAGGVVSDNNRGAIENCYNTGAVSAVSSVYSNAGGVVGSNNSGAIENCYNTGAVSSVSGVAGGVVGSNNSGAIKNCYNTGTVSGLTAVGGVVGSNNSGTIKNCYYLNTSASAGIGSGSGFPVSKTEAEMKSSGFLTQLNGGQDPAPFRADFNTLGGYLNDGYPILAWQNPFAGGSGVEGDPFLIATKEQLEAFRDLVNGGNAGIWGKLEADIDLNPGFTFASDGSYTGPDGKLPEQWTPIGVNYTGTFDGGSHTVSGVYINNTSSNQGLFGTIRGTVQNLGVINSYIRSGSGNSSTGSVAGAVLSGGSVTNCYNTGTVSGGYYTGGVVGSVTGSVTNCYNAGAVGGSSNGTGGVAGNVTGSVTNCYNAGTVTGGSQTGGVAGSVTGSVTNCYNTGTVSGGNQTGGAAGNVTGSGRVQNCYNTGAVSGGSQTGGIAGYVYTSSTVTNCYFLEGTASAGVGNGDGGATSLTAAKMTGPAAQANMNGFDFDTIWATRDDSYTAQSTGSDGNTVTVTTTSHAPYLRVFGEDSAPVLSSATSEVEKMQQETDEGGTTYYLIYDKDDLELFRDIVNGNLTEVQKLLYPEGASANGRLEADIDLNPGVTFNADGTYTENTTPEQWTPIGSSSRPYAGTFDGGGHTVSGVYINNTSAKYQGLFGYVYGSTIQNLGVVNSYIRADDYVGGIAGSLTNRAKITGCFNQAAVIGTSNSAYVGGVAGCVYSSTVTNCYNTGSVSGVEVYVGGVVGYVDSDSTVTNCYNTGAISGGEYSAAGGVVGYVNDSSITNCYNTGTIDGGSQTGGVAGYADTESTVTNCYYLDTSASVGIGMDYSGSGEATSLTIAQIEDTGENGLLAKLADGSGEGVWNTTLSSVGSWEYGKPVMQPVLTWQTPIQNPPAYFITIPEKAEAGGETSVSITADVSALPASRQVAVSVANDTVFNLYYGGDVNDDAIAYQIFADGSKMALEAGGAVLTSGNTAEGTPSKVDLTFEVADTPKYSGSYTGTLIFTVSVNTNDAA